MKDGYAKILSDKIKYANDPRIQESEFEPSSSPGDYYVSYSKSNAVYYARLYSDNNGTVRATIIMRSSSLMMEIIIRILFKWNNEFLNGTVVIGMKISQKTIVKLLLLLTIGLGIALAIQISEKNELASQLSRTTAELGQRDEELKTAKEQYQDARGKLYQTATVCDIYDSFFVNFAKNWGIELPLYEYDPKDQEIVNKAEAYIQTQVNPEQELIFKIGPVTQKENGDYIVKFITYKKLGLDLNSSKGSANLDENLAKLTGGVPPTTLKGYSLKYSDGHFEYWG